jgi:Protein of unknown function DUF262/Protein of unknown function (DUF1524)
MQEIRGEAKTIRQLLSGTRYAVDYYQREYKWQPKQVRELIQDLTGEFLDDYQLTDERPEVSDYGHYFLGSIIISAREGQKFIIDGQQRLTTMSLLLIFLHNLQRGRDDAVKLNELIFSEKYSKKSFNLDVPDRSACMEALFSQQSFEEADQPESIRNILARYRTIEEHFPANLVTDALPYFVDWLIENVHLVEITAHSDDDAYTIFETMNDRGLSLTATDMLKGYLLANIRDPEMRMRAAAAWKERISALVHHDKDEDADAIKAWLRSQHAASIRERKKNALPQDFDRIGTEFHRWVRDNTKALGLQRSPDFARFIERDLAFYTGQYLRLRQASHELTPALETVFYLAGHEFTLQYPVILSALIPEDSPAVIDQKIRIVATFLDILVARRIWNFRLIAYSTMQYAMFLVMRDIRRKDPGQLANMLFDRLQTEKENFQTNDRFHLTKMNRNVVMEVLARMTDYVERESGHVSHFVEYVNGTGKKRYEVEHIWAAKPERYVDEFPHEADFYEYRNRIGGLLLLPKSFNASYGALPYEEKLEHYNSQNLLARTLHSQCYERNPGFLTFSERSGLPFHPDEHFRRADLDERQMLYTQIAERIWDPEQLKKLATWE